MSKDTSISNIFELLTNESDKSEEVKSGIIYLKVKDQIIYGDLNVLAFEIDATLKKNHPDKWYNLKLKAALDRITLSLAKKCNARITKRIKSQLRKADKQELLYSIPEIRNLCIKETIEKEFCRPKER